jgi:hypothetical protein
MLIRLNLLINIIFYSLISSVIKFNETVGDLDPLDVSFFMASLKFAFGSSGFKFNATSVNHYVKPLWYNCGHNNFFEIKSFSREGGADTLNVWICNLRDPEIVAQGTWPPEYMNKKLMDGVGELSKVNVVICVLAEKPLVSIDALCAFLCVQLHAIRRRLILRIWKSPIRFGCQNGRKEH